MLHLSFKFALVFEFCCEVAVRIQQEFGDT